jgi:hypothetical protein
MGASVVLGARRPRHDLADRSLEIRAPNFHVELVEHCERVGVRMAVTVVASDADQADPGAGRGQERRLGRARTMVRHRHELGREPVRPASEQILLAGTFHVAGEQGASAAVRDAQDRRGVVQLARRMAERPAARWMEDLDLQVTDHDHTADARHLDVHAPTGGHREHLVHLGQLGRLGSVPHRTHPHALEHGGHTTDVVEVRVGHDQHVEPPSAVAAQPTRRSVIAAGVDEQSSARRLDQERVPLSDVDGRHRQ